MTGRIPWTRISAEGLVIVVSILLAFGIDAWWDRERERADEVVSLELLAGDLDAAVDELEEFIEFAEGTREAALSAYAALSVPGQVNRESASASILRVANRRTVRIPTAAYTDLLSTGSLRLIRQAALRNAIVRFYESAEAAESVIEKNNTVFLDGFFFSFLYRDGLLLARPTGGTGVAVVDEAHAELRAQLGDDVGHGMDRIWGLSRDSREWHSLRSTLLAVVRVFGISGGVAARTVEQAKSLREDIATETGEG